MPRRRFTVTLQPGEAARLLAFDNATHARPSWPLGENRTFRRRNRTTFEVKDHASMGAGKAMVATLGTAVLRGDDEADVTIRTKGAWVGWLLVAGGLSMLAVVPRDGVVAVALGAGLAVAGWALFLRRPGAQQDLDSIEQVLRRELVGEWTRTDDDGQARRLPG
ncbi:hypothetical protein FE634_02390 [Nocardioides dongxiaopingii]|uniref:hypothetical protein n=1 Tax=Nocardioides sp. S-1144 TaxID=2582905 RepID=UPI00110F2C72|nr:hypothetical protein [Nocardioides sp. S-1144]QCW49551.1 hypothetical protein FE634_02390 [Nocardioides sp. S-1144]